MKRVLIDASSAILLYKARLFDAMVCAYRLLVVPAVLEEITVPGHAGASAFRRACDQHRIIRLDHHQDADADQQMPPMGIGERDTLLAFASGAQDFIIIDDGKGAQVCRGMAIPYINALLCPKILLWAGCIETPVFDAAFNHLQRIGRYSARVIDYALTCTPEMLIEFCPNPCRRPRKSV